MAPVPIPRYSQTEGTYLVPLVSCRTAKLPPLRQTEVAALRHRQKKTDMDFLLCGMDREIKSRPELMMVELEDLCRPKRKGSRSSKDVENDSYRTLLRINGTFLYNLW